MHEGREQHGFYPGTFDPVHLGHLETAHNASKSVDKVWILPNPVSSKSKPDATSLDIRRDLVNIAIADHPKLSVPSDEAWDEYSRAYQSHGVDQAIEALSKHLDVDPVHIVGQDVYEKRPHTGRKVMLIPRGDHDPLVSDDVTLLPPVGEISSSEIRRKLYHGDPVEGVPPAVLSEIRKRRLYENKESKEIEFVKKWISEKITAWKNAFDPDEIHVELGGSLVSGLFVREGASKYDADVKFIVQNPEDHDILDKIEETTGLQYRKTIRIKELPPEKNLAILMEKTIVVPELSMPIDIEGCVRQGPYINSHMLYAKYFSKEELEEIRSKKKKLRNNSEAYKKYKYEVRDELMKRAGIHS